jgi:hypothetical protein
MVYVDVCIPCCLAFVCGRHKISTMPRFYTPLIEPDLWGTWVGNHPGLPGPRSHPNSSAVSVRFTLATVAGP